MEKSSRSPPLQWSRDHVVADRYASAEGTGHIIALQWSRDHVVADRGPTAVACPSVMLASMEPRPRGRGSSVLRGPTPLRGACFNGAATTWSRIAGRDGGTALRRGGASMEPRPRGRGST